MLGNLYIPFWESGNRSSQSRLSCLLTLTWDKSLSHPASALHPWRGQGLLYLPHLVVGMVRSGNIFHSALTEQLPWGTSLTDGEDVKVVTSSVITPNVS